MLRERYNQADTPLEDKALVYLNKFGFNGLYRETGRDSSIPYGHPAKCPACPETAMRTFARHLAAADLRHGDFSVALAEARPGDVVYADPPYAAPDGHASFTGYGPSGFPWSDQLRLANAARGLAGRGIPVVISNHDTEETRALYAGARLHSRRIVRSLQIAAAGVSRLNWWPCFSSKNGSHPRPPSQYADRMTTRRPPVAALAP